MFILITTPWEYLVTAAAFQPITTQKYRILSCIITFA